MCFFTSLLGTGEHGVGVGKKEYLVEELGEGTVQLMKTIKKAIDPLGIFNPGKVCAVSKIPCLRLCSSVIWKLYPDNVPTPREDDKEAR